MQTLVDQTVLRDQMVRAAFGLMSVGISLLLLSSGSHAQWAGGTADENRADRAKVDRMLRDRHREAQDRRRKQEESERQKLAAQNAAIASAVEGRRGVGSSFLGELQRADEIARKHGTSVQREFNKISKEDLLVLEKHGVKDGKDIVGPGVVASIIKIMKKMIGVDLSPWEKLLKPGPLHSHRLEQGDIYNFRIYKESIDQALRRRAQSQCSVDIYAEVNEPGNASRLFNDVGPNADFAVWNDPRDGSIMLCVTDDRCHVRSATYRNGKLDISGFEKHRASSVTYASNGWVGHTLACTVVQANKK